MSPSAGTPGTSARGLAPRRVAVIGFGLIGGSIARALRAADELGVQILGWSPTGRGPALALAAGVLHEAPDRIEDALVGADLVVLAAPPLEILDLVDRLAGELREHLPGGATVTDVASTKGAIVARAASSGLAFVGGHPMAGRESSGYGAADPDLFVERPWVVVAAPDADARDVARVEWLALACRARPVRMEAAAHDLAVAGISHLPLVAAAALVEAIAGEGATDRPEWEEARSLAASGWRDMTRLARGDVAMGAGIAATNAPALAARLRDFRAALDGWIDELERDGGPDPERLAARLRAARERLGRTPPPA